MFTTRPTLRGTFGMVSSTHWLASQSAMAMLEDGGNAYDAAVVAGFVLHVVEPNLNGPAGEVPILLAPAERPVRVLCGQGPAPAGASIEHYTSLGFELVPGAGPLAAAVPGAFDAWMLLLRDHGTKRLRDVLGYAIGYANRGHPLSGHVSDTIDAVRSLFETEWTTSAEVYLASAGPPAPGRLFRNPALAATWQRLLAEAEAAGSGREAQIEAARRTWREGFIGEALTDFAARPTMDTSGERHPGTLTGDDLAAFAATYEAPATYDWHDWTVCKPGPWSQGPVFLQQLALLKEGLSPDAPEYVHVLTEGCKLAMADREAWYGDAAEVPLTDLLSADYNTRRRDLITGQASLALRPGHPGGRTPRLPAYITADAIVGAGASRNTAVDTAQPVVSANGRTAGDTCHLDVVDRWGNMVAATPSGGWLQSNPLVPSLGFPLGSRLQSAWLEPNLPNSLTPGRRPRTTLSPTLALRGGSAVLAFGTPGGDQQDQWQIPFFLSVALGEAPPSEFELQEAIDTPNWHTDSFPASFHPRATDPGSLTVESRIGEEIVAGLRRRGHRVAVGGPWSEGKICAVSRDPETGMLSAGASPRGMSGYAVGR